MTSSPQDLIVLCLVLFGCGWLFGLWQARVEHGDYRPALVFAVFSIVSLLLWLSRGSPYEFALLWLSSVGAGMYLALRQKGVYLGRGNPAVVYILCGTISLFFVASAAYPEKRKTD